jgi:hypothetical protein
VVTQAANEQGGLKAAIDPKTALIAITITIPQHSKTIMLGI